MMHDTRRSEARLRLSLHMRLATGVSVSVLDIAVDMCVCGWVRIGGHDPGERREGRVDKEGRMGTAVVAVACVTHVKKKGRKWG